MWRGANGYGSHAETGVAAPSTTWFLAEGATTGDFSLFYLLQNAGDAAVTATVRFLRPSGLPPIVKAYTLPPRSRTTIPVDDEGPELPATDVSAVIQASAPIMVERAMYATRAGQAFAAGHDSAGVVAPATSWFRSTGETHTKTYTVPANGRSTIWVDNEELPTGSGVRPSEQRRGVLCHRIHGSDRGRADDVVASPALGPACWTGSHNSPGATETGTRWALAEGEVGGLQRSETYILIANPSSHAGSARVTVYEGTWAAGTNALATRLP
jgi:hypothetical protein